MVNIGLGDIYWSSRINSRPPCIPVRLQKRPSGCSGWRCWALKGVHWPCGRNASPLKRNNKGVDYWKTIQNTHTHTHTANHTHTHTHSHYTHSHTHTHTHTHSHTHSKSLTHSHSHTHTHTHTCWFLWFTGTLHRRNGFYTVQAVCAIALHLPYT